MLASGNDYILRHGRRPLRRGGKAVLLAALLLIAMSVFLVVPVTAQTGLGGGKPEGPRVVSQIRHIPA